jgi:dTDP-4-dehydrorhamnose 3,5-epimerase
MEVIKSDIEGVVIIEPRIFEDSRGYFFESFSEREFVEKVCNTRFVQDNESKSSYGVVRGLHFQLPPHAQSKLVRVTEGEILDIAVDIRRGSPTFGKYVAVTLSAENKRQLFIPRGFAHGFVVRKGEATVEYLCDAYYAPDAEGAIVWDDPTIGIDWGVENPIVSAKDAANRRLEECDTLFDYNEDYYA